METKYAVVLIKPDAIRDVLEEMILQDLREGALVDSVFRKLLKINENLAKLIYPTWVEKPEFPSMVHNITRGNSLFVVVRGDNTIYESLRRVKGKMNQGGLRLKYRTHSIEEWQALGYVGRELRNRIAENRFHTTDDLNETISLCALVMNHQDIETIKSVAPLLAIAIHDKIAVQPWTAP